jgi:hypothetical protein
MRRQPTVAAAPGDRPDLAKALRMHQAQSRILAPLPRAEQAEFLRMLRVLVDANNELSRAPSDSS